MNLAVRRGRFWGVSIFQMGTKQRGRVGASASDPKACEDISVELLGQSGPPVPTQT